MSICFITLYGLASIFCCGLCMHSYVVMAGLDISG